MACHSRFRSWEIRIDVETQRLNSKGAAMLIGLAGNRLCLLLSLTY
jgi:hypothetical protein